MSLSPNRGLAPPGSRTANRYGVEVPEVERSRAAASVEFIISRSGFAPSPRMDPIAFLTLVIVSAPVLPKAVRRPRSG
jgi:hypothetical protein